MCRVHCERVFPIVAIFYHYTFRTKKSIELSLDCFEQKPHNQLSEQRAETRRLAQKLVDARRELCRCSPMTNIAQLVCHVSDALQI